MKNTADIKFEKPLTYEQFLFWNSFIDKFPYNQNCYTQSILDHFSNTNYRKHISFYDLNEDLNLCKSPEDVFSTFKQYNFSEDSIGNFKKAFYTHKELLETDDVKQLTLFTIYCSRIQNMSLSIKEDGIYIDSKLSSNILKNPVALETSFICDLMNGRLSDFFNEHQDKIIAVNESMVPIYHNESGTYFVHLKKSSNSFFINNGENTLFTERIMYNKSKDTHIIEFTIDLSKNSDDINSNFFEQEQNNFLKILQMNLISNKIENKSITKNKTNKI